ncbi:hypothetical protein V6N12_050006 [Hibiscus sabdariffa]|uniref:Uncharacterized protein n=1 Tax=Hibiscus sabdariffa TaxID=183260 RepID=A0ABR2GB66_9ROSI
MASGGRVRAQPEGKMKPKYLDAEVEGGEHAHKCGVDPKFTRFMLSVNGRGRGSVADIWHGCVVHLAMQGSLPFAHRAFY